MADQIFFDVVQNPEFWPTSEAKSGPKDTTAPIHMPVRDANELFGSIERKIDGLEYVDWLTVGSMTGQIFFAVVQNPEFWPTSEAKSGPKNTTAPIS